MKRKHRRLSFAAVGMLLLGIAVALVLTAFEENIVFFFSPSEVLQKAEAMEIKDTQRLRLGGLVEEGSWTREGATNRFRVTDTVSAVPVNFTGILPDLFREGQGVVAEGHLVDGVFIADDVLAKHDENYMPPEVAQSLKDAKLWQHMKDKDATPAE